MQKANPCLLELAHLFTANFNLINTWSITLLLIPYIFWIYSL